MSIEGSSQIHSFRKRFKLEGLIHKIGRWGVAVPFGIPLRSLGDAVGAGLWVLPLDRLRGVGLWGALSARRCGSSCCRCWSPAC